MRTKFPVVIHGSTTNVDPTSLVLARNFENISSYFFLPFGTSHRKASFMSISSAFFYPFKTPSMTHSNVNSLA